MRALRIGVVGGHERANALLARRAAALGCRLEHHDGHTARGTEQIDALVARVDAVVICTDVNSHNAVHAARRAAARHHRRTVLVRRCGPDALAALIASLALPLAA